MFSVTFFWLSSFVLPRLKLLSEKWLSRPLPLRSLALKAAALRTLVHTLKDLALAMTILSPVLKSLACKPRPQAKQRKRGDRKGEILRRKHLRRAAAAAGQRPDRKAETERRKAKGPGQQALVSAKTLGGRKSLSSRLSGASSAGKQLQQLRQQQSGTPQHQLRRRQRSSCEQQQLRQRLRQLVRLLSSLARSSRGSMR